MSYIYTITDYAKDKGLTRQCIHMRLAKNDEMRKHTKMVNGKKYMDYTAYEYLESIFRDNKIVSLQDENKRLIEENNLLQNQSALFLKELKEIKVQLADLINYVKERDTNEH